MAFVFAKKTKMSKHEEEEYGTALDARFAQSLLGYTTASSGDDSRSSARIADPHGFMGKRVVLTGLVQDALNGTAGVVTAIHPLAKTYSVLLDGGGRRTVHVPPQNLLLVFFITPQVADEGGEYDVDDARETKWATRAHVAERTVSVDE